MASPKRRENMKPRTSKNPSFELILPRGMEEPWRHGEEERIQDYPQIGRTSEAWGRRENPGLPTNCNSISGTY
jgi:hypothetical protein